MVSGAKKEGMLGLLKGTGKGVLGLVLRPTGGIIDLASAALSTVQKCVFIVMCAVSTLVCCCCCAVGPLKLGILN